MITAAQRLWSYRELTANLTRRELRAKHKKSLLGWCWSLINPASTLAIYTFVFGSLLKIEPPVAGNGELKSFALYLFSGLFLWNLFNANLNGAMGALQASGGMLNKVYFPPECPAVASLFVNYYQSVIEAALLVFFLTLGGNVGWTFLWLPVIVVFTAILGFGTGLLLSAANVRFRDVGYLVNIALQLLFYATPIVYRAEMVPERVNGIPLRAIFNLNPLAAAVQSSRDVAYGLSNPKPAALIYLVVSSLVILVIGYSWFSYRAPQVIEEI